MLKEALGRADGGVATMMGEELARAPDAQVLRIVDMVDRLPRRGQADGLVEALRPRLRLLRPNRRLRVERLLFLPADRIIVPGGTARHGEPRLPRPAVAALGAMLTRALPGLSEAAQLALDRTTDPEDVLAIGETVWPRAAEALRAADMPPDWTDRRLAPSSFRDLSLGAAALLASGTEIVSLHVRGDASVAASTVTRMIERAGARDGPGFAMLIAVLVQVLPHCPEIVRLLGEVARRGGSAASGVIEAQLRELEAASPLPSPTRPEGCAELAQRAAVLQMMQDGLPGLPQKRRVATARAQLSQGCAHRFTTTIGEAVITPLQALTASSAGLSDEALRTMEADARMLRRFATHAAVLGDGPQYEGALAGAIAQVAVTSLAAAERARLVEILDGPQAALALLQRLG